jgi:hypothetical protein
MHLIEIMPFMSLLLTVHGHTGIGLLAVEDGSGREEKEHDQPEDDASASESDSSFLTHANSRGAAGVTDHLDLQYSKP